MRASSSGPARRSEAPATSACPTARESRTSASSAPSPRPSELPDARSDLSGTPDLEVCLHGLAEHPLHLRAVEGPEVDRPVLLLVPGVAARVPHGRAQRGCDLRVELGSGLRGRLDRLDLAAREALEPPQD